MVVRRAAWNAVAGVALGLGGTLILTRFLTSALFGVRPADPAALGGASVFLFVIAVAAGWIPARRAAALDPMIALRAE